MAEVTERDLSVKRENVTFVEMDIEARRRFIGQLITSDSVKVPVLLGFFYPEDDDECMGDVYIYEKQDEGISKTFYEVFIVCVEQSTATLNQIALKVGLKEIFKKFKAEKITVDSIYVHQDCGMNHKDVTNITLQVQDILMDYRLEDKVRIWAENLETVIDETEECGCECSCKEKNKSKKKNKKDKDKKKKKKGKK